MRRGQERKVVPGVDEVTELIAEGTSTPAVTASDTVLSVARGVVRGVVIERTVAPTGSATDIGLPETKNFNSLVVPISPLSVGNVAEVQGLANEDPNKVSPRFVRDPISPERPLNAPLNPRDVAGSRTAAERIAAEKPQEERKADEVLVEKASVDGPTLVRDDEEKGTNGLTELESQKVDDLKRRDAEVRAHEQAHAAAGGPYAGAPRFRFVRGPDGKFYAVAGEVTIDTSAVPGNPQATIRKMQQVKRAALAPQEPSAQDHRVAAEAERKIMQARHEIHEEENDKVRRTQEKQQQQEAEAQGFERSITPEQAPVFDPESRFRSNTGGTGPAPGTGLAGTGGLDVDASDVIDPKALFSMIA